jgi:hypothetical protein
VALKKTVKDKLVKGFKDDLGRARTVFDRIALNGAYQDGDGFRKLMNHDRRDIAQYVFFEIAAQYEGFCCEAFKIEIRHRFGVEPQRAVHLMGSSDKGLAGVMGWASPHQVQSRAQALNGKNGFFGRFEKVITKPVYDRLAHAHKVRNRIAHNGGKAVKDYNKILPQMQVPQGARKGLSVGRLLMDYPSTSPTGQRWFNLFLDAYELVVNEYDKSIVIPS